MQGTGRLLLLVVLLLGGLVGPLITPAPPVAAYPIQGNYQGEPLENCPDPSITKVEDHPTDDSTHWYLFCTGNPLNDGDLATNHLFAILESTDLVTWTYAGDVFTTKPTSVPSDALLWAPDVHHYHGTWYLYYTVAEQTSYINVATTTSRLPTSGWQDHGQVVESQPNRWVIDPHVVVEGNERYLFYGSYAGGISARQLSADGLRPLKLSETQITVADRYEGVFIHKRQNGWYYLFASSTNCCNGPLTGYSVFVGRSERVLGPYLDREGVALLDSRVGGTPVISMNGNRWVGPGHNSIVPDYAGQDWFVYHGVDRDDAYFHGTGFTKRAAMLDPLDWLDATGGRHADDPDDRTEVWPTVRGGLWASESTTDENGQDMLPAAQPGLSTTYPFRLAPKDLPGAPIPELSDEFQEGLGSQWGWVNPLATGTSVGTKLGWFRFDTQAGDHAGASTNNAAVLVEPTPPGDYLVETKVHLNVPATGSSYNYVQAGLVIYLDHDQYIKLVQVAINGTRQTEFAKETQDSYGHTVVGPPSAWTWLRIVKRATASGEQYTAYTSHDGVSWVRGGTWTHNLGPTARIGLVSMARSGFTANFDYVHVFNVTTTPGP